MDTQQIKKCDEKCCDKKNIKCLGMVFLAIVSIFFIALTVNQIRSYKFIGQSVEAKNVISFDGKGEVSASPDIANVTFTVRKENKTLKLAQNDVTVVVNEALKFLKDSGIVDKDIKTENYSSYPKYEYDGVQCLTYPCPVKAPVLKGYEVSQSVSVKVRDIDNVGSLIGSLGNLTITEISGPNFAIEKEDAFKIEARKLAIKEAKDKAESLAKDLGVNLVRIVSFSEGGNYPIYYNRADTMMAGAASPKEASPTPQLPTGENKIISNVTITYEIR